MSTTVSPTSTCSKATGHSLVFAGGGGGEEVNDRARLLCGDLLPKACLRVVEKVLCSSDFFFFSKKIGKNGGYGMCVVRQGVSGVFFLESVV